MEEILWPVSLGDAFKPFEHAEHRTHGDEADYQEYHPGNPYRALVVNQRTDPQQEVTKGGGGEPKTLAETLQILRGELLTRTERPRGEINSSATVIKK